MNNLILQFTPVPYCEEKALILRVSNKDYLRFAAGMMIKIDPKLTIHCGAKFKLVCGDNYAYCRLRNVIGDYGYFTK